MNLKVSESDRDNESDVSKYNCSRDSTEASTFENSNSTRFELSINRLNDILVKQLLGLSSKLLAQSWQGR